LDQAFTEGRRESVGGFCGKVRESRSIGYAGQCFIKRSEGFARANTGLVHWGQAMAYPEE
jgi:hypothetical protein